MPASSVIRLRIICWTWNRISVNTPPPPPSSTDLNVSRRWFWRRVGGFAPPPPKVPPVPPPHGYATDLNVSRGKHWDSRKNKTNYFPREQAKVSIDFWRQNCLKAHLKRCMKRFSKYICFWKLKSCLSHSWQKVIFLRSVRTSTHTSMTGF